MIKNFIFLGAPGVGKGTLARIISSKKGLVHISTGDIFRYHIKKKTELGKKIQAILISGEYVPDDITNKILYERINKDDVKKNGFILDGYPRTFNQVKFLETKGLKINKVILLNAPSKVIQKRLENRAKFENRTDDTPEVIANRIFIYYKKISSLIDYYQKKELIVNIDASGTVTQNLKSLMEILFAHDPS